MSSIIHLQSLRTQFKDTIHPALGAGGRRFESCHLDNKLGSLFYRGFFVCKFKSMNNIKYIALFFLIFPLHADVNYNSQIQPIFDNHCISCHVNGGAYFGNLDLSSYSEVMEGGSSGNTIVPFNYENSLLWQYVNSSYMPPYGSGIDLLTSSLF